MNNEHKAVRVRYRAQAATIAHSPPKLFAPGISFAISFAGNLFCPHLVPLNGQVLVPVGGGYSIQFGVRVREFYFIYPFPLPQTDMILSSIEYASEWIIPILQHPPVY